MTDDDKKDHGAEPTETASGLPRPLARGLLRDDLNTRPRREREAKNDQPSPASPRLTVAQAIGDVILATSLDYVHPSIYALIAAVHAEDAETIAQVTQERDNALEELESNRACNLYTWKERATTAETNLAQVTQERDALLVYKPRTPVDVGGTR